MRKRLTETIVTRQGPVDGKPTRVWDEAITGLVLCISAKGKKSFAVYCDGKYYNLGKAPPLTLADAKLKATDFLRNPTAALQQAQEDTFKELAESWFTKVIKPKKIRTETETYRMLTRYVYPSWDTKRVSAITKNEVTKLIDKLTENHGVRQADRVHGLINQILRWHMNRTDGYIAPIVARDTSVAKRKRQRVLSDAEIRAFWACTETMGIYGAMMRFALLSGQRREKVCRLRWDAVKNKVWTVESDHAREKGHVGVVKLPQLALDVIDSQQRLGANPFVFAAAGTKDKPLSGHNKRKAELDARMKRILPEWNEWRTHDLRRTARTLMSRAGVSSDVAERVLGHKVQGVESVYDIWEYTQQKSDALKALARLIEGILNDKTPSTNRTAHSAAVQHTQGNVFN